MSKFLIFKNQLIFLIFLILFFSLNFGTAFALEIKDYPSVPGVQAPGDCQDSDPNCLPRMVTYFIGLGIYLAGGIAAISFTVGAVQYIASMDSPELKSGAVDRMKGSVLGLIIAVSAVVLSKSISDDLAKISLKPLPGVAGVFYTKGEFKKPAPEVEPDVSKITEGYNAIKYCCSDDCSGGKGPTLIIWEYPQINLRGDDKLFSGVNIVKLKCGESEDIKDFQSFKTAYEIPGVYYFMESNCGGYMSPANLTSENKLADPFRQNIKSIKIINAGGEDNTYFYGAIFHKEEGLKNGGECTLPLLSSGETEVCRDIDIEASAVDIFLVNQNPETSGNGVSFYSEKHGWDTGSKAGFYDVYPSQISLENENDYYGAKSFCFSYENIDVPDWYKYKCVDSNCGGTGLTTEAEDCDDYKDCLNSTFGGVCINGKCSSSDNCASDDDCQELERCDGLGRCVALGSAEGVDCSDTACETFKDCPGSIKIKGSYLVGLYSKQEDEDKKINETEDKDDESLGNKSPICLTFTKDTESLQAEQFITPGQKDLKRIYIAPTE